MTIDIGVGVIVLVFALLGLASGFWAQMMRLGALASLYFIAPPVARAIEDPVAGFMSADATPRAVAGVALIAAAVGLYLVMSFVIWMILRALRGDKPMDATNRALGFSLGLVKGAALCYFVLAGLVLVSQSGYYSAQLVESDFWVKNAANSSLVELVSANNLLVEMGYELPTPLELQEELEQLGVDAADLPVDGLGAGQPPGPAGIAPGPGGAPGQVPVVGPGSQPPLPGGGPIPGPTVGPGGLPPSPGGMPPGMPPGGGMAVPTRPGQARPSAK